MHERSRIRGLPAFGIAAGGLLLGHALSYLIAIPDPHHRFEVLERTGHGYVPTAAQLALVLVLASVVTVLARGLRGPGLEPEERFGALAVRLAVVQVFAFAALEVLERLSSAGSLADLAHGHLLAVGILVQIGVALLGAAALRSIDRAAVRASGSLVPRILPRPSLSFALPLAPRRPAGRSLVGASGVRGPPSR